jgi:DNA ligase-1
MRFSELAATSQVIASSRSRKAKTAALADLLQRLEPLLVGSVVAWLAGTLRQGRIGVGPALIQALQGVASASEPTLRVEDVERAFEELARVTGAGSQERRRALLAELLERSTQSEAEFLRRLLLGELRQGAQLALLIEAVAAAARAGVDDVRRATMVEGDLAPVAQALFQEGSASLQRFRLTVGRPVLPMLAQPAEDLDELFARQSASGYVAEPKLDGARVQIHRDGDRVRVFTRQLNEVTSSVPEILEAVAALRVDSIVLDGEAVTLDAEGRPRPFQVTMRRFGRRLDVERLRAELPLSFAAFDVLLVNGEACMGRPARERFALLREHLPPSLTLPQSEVGSVEQVAAALAWALRAGHEGLVLKALDSAYEAGRRGSGWLKLKPAHTLDLVVLAAEWGSGRRRGWLSNLHLGAREPDGAGFVMLGKTFKGLTDELLAWQTDALLSREVARTPEQVTVRPELVVEVAFDGVQVSPQYPGGVALRFARVKRYRPDKDARDADTLTTVKRFAAESGGP